MGICVQVRSVAVPCVVSRDWLVIIFDGTPRCMEPCDSNNTCSNGGGCADFGGGLLLCVCQRDQDCGLGKQCDLVFRDQGVGSPRIQRQLHRRQGLSQRLHLQRRCLCLRKAHRTHRRKALGSATEPTPELFEPAVEKIAENAPEEAVVVSEEIAQDAGPSDSSNNSPEMTTEPERSSAEAVVVLSRRARKILPYGLLSSLSLGCSCGGGENAPKRHTIFESSVIEGETQSAVEALLLGHRGLPLPLYNHTMRGFRTTASN